MEAGRHQQNIYDALLHPTVKRAKGIKKKKNTFFYVCMHVCTFLLIYNHLKLIINVFTWPSSESAMLHLHVSTVAQNIPNLPLAPEKAFEMKCVQSVALCNSYSILYTLLYNSRSRISLLLMNVRAAHESRLQFTHSLTNLHSAGPARGSCWVSRSYYFLCIQDMTELLVTLLQKHEKKANLSFSADTAEKNKTHF